MTHHEPNRHMRFDMRCVDSGHAWLWITDFNITYGLGMEVVQVKRRMQCDKCRTIRVDKYGLPNFDLVGRYYVYDDLYFEQRDEGRQDYFNRMVQASALHTNHQAAAAG